MDTSFHYLLMVNQAKLQKMLFAQLKDTCLTMGQPKILDYLKDHDGANQKEIANGCQIEAPSLTSLLGPMEQKNLIERRMLNGNRRSLHIFLTPKGREYQQLIEQQFIEIENKAFANIPDSEQEQFMETLIKISKNLCNDL